MYIQWHGSVENDCSVKETTVLKAPIFHRTTIVNGGSNSRFNPRTCWVCWVSIKLQPFSSDFMITSCCQNACVPSDIEAEKLAWTFTWIIIHRVSYYKKHEKRSSFPQLFHCSSLTAASLVVTQRKLLYMLSYICCKRRSKGRFNAPWTTTQAQTASTWTSQAA